MTCAHIVTRPLNPEAARIPLLDHTRAQPLCHPHAALQIKAVGFNEDGYFGRLDAQRAAVAADLVLAWRLCREGRQPANGAFQVGSA